MKGRLTSIVIFSLLIMGFFFIENASGRKNDKEIKKILVLHSYHKGLSWTEKVVRGIEEVITEDGGDHKISLDFEYMDTKRFFEKKYYKYLYDLYKYKYADKKYDVIISVDDNALNFLLKYKSQIFPDTPVVFCGVNFLDEKKIKEFKEYTGVVEAFDVKSTVEIALKFHPTTKKIIFVGDSSTTSVNNVKAVKKFEKHFLKRGVSFSYLNDSDIMRYQRDLETIDDTTLVVALLFNRDVDGNFYTYLESFKLYSLNVNRPIYTFWGFYLGDGAIGGKIISGESQGATAAKLALEILGGKRVEEVPIIKESPNKYVFDYKQLRKYDVPGDLIPGKATLLNKPVGFSEFYNANRLVFQSVIFFILFLLLVIFILIFNIIKRKKVEKQLIVTNKSYSRFVPYDFLTNLHKSRITDVKLGDKVEIDATLLFCDIRSFTKLSEQMSPEDNFKFINSYLNVISPVIRNNGGFINKYVGDAILAIFPSEINKAVEAAIEIQKRLMIFNEKRVAKKRFPIKIGIGLHRDKLLLGTIGDEKRMDSAIISNAVDYVSQLESITRNYDAAIIASHSVVENKEFYENIFLKRKVGHMDVDNKSLILYEILEGNPAEVVELKLKTKTFFDKGLICYNREDYKKATEYFNNVLKLNPADKAAKYYLEKI